MTAYNFLVVQKRYKMTSVSNDLRNGRKLAYDNYPEVVFNNYFIDHILLLKKKEIFLRTSIVTNVLVPTLVLAIWQANISCVKAAILIL